MEQHFRNICESGQTIIHKGEEAPVLKSTDDILEGLGSPNVSRDEDQENQPPKKLKKMKKKPGYLVGTANSRAKTVSKSPIRGAGGAKN